MNCLRSLGPVTLLAQLALVTLTARPMPAAEPPPEPPSAIDPILEVMGTLESARDPKCHATASRLEDFMYGTPLELEARVEKTRLQKTALRAAWAKAAETARTARTSAGESVDLADLWPALQQLAPVEVPEWAKSNPPYSATNDTLGDWRVGTATGPVVVTARDLRQYGSVAYGLRAILAVQQEELLDEKSTLSPLTPAAIATAKRHLDLMTLVALQGADRRARAAGARQIDAATFRAAWAAAFEPAVQALLTGPTAPTSAPSTEMAYPEDRESRTKLSETSKPSEPAERFATLRAVVREKLAAYEKYNDLAMPVFLRNIQVYFARHRWPTDAAASEELRSAFNATMVAFTHDLLIESERVALARGNLLIREDDVHRAAERFLPFEANAFEDILYFPRLPRADRVKIEAYDLDSFRDPGLHWVYLDTVLADPNYPGKLEPDPFGAELLVEVVAQFGVLVLRTAGDVARETEEPRLSVTSLENGLRRIQDRIDRSARLPPLEGRSARLPTPASADANPTRAGTPSTGSTAFSDVTAQSGIAYSHRLADWAARRIRSLQVTADGTGKLAIPPAFGGSGVAAEDFDGDGDTDLLILGGAGNRIYANDGKGAFRDVTSSSGLEWRRPDNTYGEARQPIVADFDNDGRPDVLITYLDDDHRVYRNLGGLRFEDQTEGSGLGGAGLAGGPATAADFDRDGLVDVFIGYFGDWPRGVLPTLSRRSVNAQTDRIFRNISALPTTTPGGRLRFADQTAGSGIENPGWAQSVGHVDFDRDGREDLIVGNDFGINAYYRNLGERPGDFRFEDWAAKLGVDKPSYTMNVGLTDWNRDGFPDVYISNIVMMNKDEKYVLPDENTPMKFDAKKLATMRVVETNDFWVSEAEGRRLAGYVQSPDVGRGKASTGWAWDADFFDADNDGDDDLYVLDGMNEYAVYSSVHPYFADSPGLENVVVPVALQEQNVFFENVGIGSGTSGTSGASGAAGQRRLEEATDRSGLGLVGNSRSAAYLDLENDGDLDIVVQAFLGDATVYRNDLKKMAASGGPANAHWIALRLEGDPARGTNRDAIGATLRIDSASHPGQWRQVSSTIGYLSVHPKTQHVGLGADRQAVVTVRWPNGAEEVFRGLAADRLHLLRQGTSAKR